MVRKSLNAGDLEEFKEQLIQDEKSPVTVEKYMRDVRSFAAFAGEQAITKELTMAYKQHLEERNYAVRSINSMLVAVNSLLAFLGLESCKVKLLRCQRQIYRTEQQELSRGEYLRLLKASEGRPWLNLVLQTICATGIRISELRYFTVEGVRRGEIIVRCKNKIRTIFVPDQLKKMILNFAKKRGISRGMVFVTRNGKPLDRSYIWSQMKSLCRQARVDAKKVFPHNLRKLFARAFYAIDKDLAKLADLLGHSSIETTRIYIMGTGNEHRKKLDRLGLLIAGNQNNSEKMKNST